MYGFVATASLDRLARYRDTYKRLSVEILTSRPCTFPGIDMFGRDADRSA